MICNTPDSRREKFQIFRSCRCHRRKPPTGRQSTDGLLMLIVTNDTTSDSSVYDCRIVVQLCGTIQRRADCSFHRLFDPLPSGLHILERRVESVPSATRQVCLAMLRLQPLRFFQPFYFFLRLSVHASTKTSNT
uniref:Uncharacterized protein n=1 Tax=Solanum tuberosum TaxID=4113 RepID=M1DS93_SOLTU